MPVRVACPHCQAAINAPSKSIGQTVKCPNCSRAFQVPAPAGHLLPPTNIAPAPPPPAPADPFASLESAGGFGEEKFCTTCGAGLHNDAVVCPKCGCEQPMFDASGPSARRGGSNGSKVAAGVLGILLGALGIHKFVLGYPIAGLIMLLVSIVGSFCFFIGPIVMSVIGLVEGILYLCMDDRQFQKTHGRHQRPWF